MSPIQTELLALIEKMDETKQHQLLDVARQFVYKPPRHYTAVELLELPEEEREAYIAWSFAQAEGVEFEIFEAYSEEDIDDVYLCATEEQIHHKKGTC
ncbi:MAG: hypothetical protein MUE54_04635 [Anaerolineae bacterium]|nr:hypothetical protein [Anaerolineae bacterium]